MTIEKVLKNVKAIGTVSKQDFENEIICAFEDYEVNGETEVVVNGSSNSGYDYIAYINDSDADQILMTVEETENEIIITDAWLA